MGLYTTLQDPANKFKAWKWINLLVFSMMYITMYVGRYNFNTLLPQISQEMNLSQGINDLLYSSVFFAYAVGCLINGYLADTHHPKVLIVLGAAGSILANLAMHFAGMWQAMLFISLLNGYAQSMVWVSGIAIMIQWWQGEERGIAVGIANLSSGFSSLVLLAIPGFIFNTSSESWREGLLSPMFLVIYFTIVFCAVSKEEPQDADLMPYKETEEAQVEEELLRATVPPKIGIVMRHFFKDSTILYWCAIGFLSSLCRYGILAWIPRYYSTGSTIVNFDKFQSNAGIIVGMALGTLVVAYITGKFFNNNKGVAVTMCAGLSAAIVVVFPTLNSATIALIGMFFTGFFLFGLNGLLWLYAMDTGTRVYAATIAGIMNCFAYIGATFETYIFSFILKISGDWIFIFVAIDIICIAMVLFGCLICRASAKKKDFSAHEEIVFELIRKR